MRVFIVVNLTTWAMILKKSISSSCSKPQVIILALSFLVFLVDSNFILKIHLAKIGIFLLSKFTKVQALIFCMDSISYLIASYYPKY